MRAEASGGTRVALSIRVCAVFDCIDPALAPDPTLRSSWPRRTPCGRPHDATCAKLLRYPDSPTPVGHDYNLVPEVATGYPAISRDGKTYTFTIRKGYRFSTGAPVTAANYVARSTASSTLRCARRAPPTCRTSSADAVQQGAALTAQANQLIVRLTKRVPDFPARMTMPYLCPVPTDLPITPEGRRGAAARLRPLLRRGVRPRQPRRAEAQSLLPRLEAPSPRPDCRPDRRRPRSATSAQGRSGHGRRRPQRSRRSTLAELAAKYGVNKQQFFVVRAADMFYTLMNTERPLFKNNPKLRQAVNFALDRTAMLLLDFAESSLAHADHRQLPAAGAAGLHRRAPLSAR